MISPRAGSNITDVPPMEPERLDILALILGLVAVILMIAAMVIYVVIAYKRRKDEPLTNCKCCMFRLGFQQKCMPMQMCI